MRVKVLHHAACFDGAASAAVFATFFRQCISSEAVFHYLPKQHRPGRVYDEEDFHADVVAVLDFRYSRDERVTWFFDHHVSAFQLRGEREHFERDRSGRKFHDATAPSCTGMIARIARESFGFDASALEELLHWAELIDSASFPDPEVPVRLRDPALQLMTFIEHVRDDDLAATFIQDLTRYDLATLANADYVARSLQPVLERHRDDIDLLRKRCRVAHDVIEFNLLDQPARAYNKFIPYYLHRGARYLVGLSVAPDGNLKLGVGYNPWLPPEGREHDIARICERFSGGGHPFVGGASFAPSRAQDALDAQQWVLDVLRGNAP